MQNESEQKLKLSLYSETAAINSSDSINTAWSVAKIHL